MQTKVILENAGSWETPPPLSSFLKHGEMTVNAYCSRIWVQQRIIPSDRQNIDDLIRRNKLHPIKSTPKNKLFLKSEIIQRNWK
jgi:hypothetical protein